MAVMDIKDARKIIKDLSEKPYICTENYIETESGYVITKRQPQADKWIPCKPDKPLEEDENCASKEFLEGCKEVAKKYKKPTTNADRIRNMTDEELAVYTCEIQQLAIDRNKADKVEDALQWLQSEVKEGNSNENT